jgi:hypothetical protein
MKASSDGFERDNLVEKKNRKNTPAMISVAVFSLVIMAGFLASYAEDSDTAKVIFHVG